MKTSLLSTLLLVFSISLYAQEKTYIIEIDSLTQNSVSMSWHRADGSSDKDNNQPFTWYYVDCGIKGFHRSVYTTSQCSWAGSVLISLIPDTEFSLFIRKQSVSADSPVWFEEYN